MLKTWFSSCFIFLKNIRTDFLKLNILHFLKTGLSKHIFEKSSHCWYLPDGLAWRSSFNPWQSFQMSVINSFVFFVLFVLFVLLVLFVLVVLLVLFELLVVPELPQVQRVEGRSVHCLLVVSLKSLLVVIRLKSTSTIVWSKPQSEIYSTNKCWIVNSML